MDVGLPCEVSCSYASALAGYRTLLHDTSELALEKAAAEITALLEKGVATGRVTGALWFAGGKVRWELEGKGTCGFV